MWLFHKKTNPSVKWRVSVFPSIVELKESKAFVCLKRLHHFSRCCEIWNNEELSYLDVKKCYPTTLSISLHREPYIPVFHFISYLADHQIQTVKGNIFRGVFWDMKGWWADLCSRKILSYYTQKQSSERVLQRRFSWNFHEIHRKTQVLYTVSSSS